MCGRFFVAEEGEDALLSRMIEEASRRQKAIIGASTVAAGEIVPSAAAAVIARGRSGEEGAFPMEWGFHRADGKGLIINTRSETALDRPLFRASMRDRRCLIPCSWYFEWERKEDGPEGAPPAFQALPQDSGRRGKLSKVRYAIRPKAPGVMYLAGIYRYEPGRPLPVFSVLTRRPAPEIAFIHDRMPVIFLEKSLWLDRAADPGEALEKCETEMAFRPA